MSDPSQAGESSQRWYTRPFVVVVSLVVFFPVGLVLTWMSGWTARTKIIVSAATMATVLLLGLASNSPGSRSTVTVAHVGTTERSVAPEPTITVAVGVPRETTVSAARPVPSSAVPTSLAQPPSNPPPPTPPPGSCRAGDPLANVYHPGRLRVLDACRTISGTVIIVRHESDADYHIDVRLDPPFASMINQRNIAAQHGALVVEIVAADGPGCNPGRPPLPAHGTYDYGICTGAGIRAPTVGQHVQVTGPYVLDSTHGWMEIHPAWQILVLP